MQETEGDSAGPDDSNRTAFSRWPLSLTEDAYRRARTESPTWDEIERRLRQAFEKTGRPEAHRLASHVCHALWCFGEELARVTGPHSTKARGRPADWRKAARRLETLALEMRGYLGPTMTHELLRAYAREKLGPGVSGTDRDGRAVLYRTETPDFASVLSLFEGFASYVEEHYPSGGRDGDPGQRSARRWFAFCVSRTFFDNGLPLGIGEGSLLPRIARLVFDAFQVKGDARDDLRTLFANNESDEAGPDTPAYPPVPRVEWWGGIASNDVEMDAKAERGDTPGGKLPD